MIESLCLYRPAVTSMRNPKAFPVPRYCPGTKWEDLPDTWSCPLCGAPKPHFVKRENRPFPLKDEGPKQMTPERELSAIEVSVICSNLARGCEKQYLDKESEQFSLLAAKFAAAEKPAKKADFASLLALVAQDLAEGYPYANYISGAGKGPRSPARACLEREGHQYAAISAVPICQGGGSDAGTYRCLSVYHLWFCLIGDTPRRSAPFARFPVGNLKKLRGGLSDGRTVCRANLRLCTKDCLCLYVCPTGATDTENSIIDRKKCIGCGRCAAACPSGAISMVPKEMPPQQPKSDQVIDALRVLIQSKNQAELVASQLPGPLAEAIRRSCRLMAEDLCREAGYMLPQSGNTRALLEHLSATDACAKELADSLLSSLSFNEPAPAAAAPVEKMALHRLRVPARRASF